MPIGVYKRTPENTTRYWFGKKRKDMSGEKHPNWRGGKLEKNCIICNDRFFVKQQRKLTAKFCSKKCLSLSKLGLTKDVKCNFCSKDFKTFQSVLKSGGGKFCSGTCYHKSLKGKIGYWKGKERPEMRIPKSEEHKRKISLSNSVPRPERRGKNNPSWKGGITDKNKTIRHSFEYKLWRRAVFERDKYTCIWCGVRGKSGIKVTLHADHIKSFAYYPELRFAIDNGRTLCVECHKKTDTFCRKLKKL